MKTKAIELIKKLTNTTMSDEIITHHIDNAEQAIKLYLNDNTIDVLELYFNEVVDLASYYITKSTLSQGSVENGAIKSISSAGRSVTFMTYDDVVNFGIPDFIKARLPKPKATVKVW